MKIAILSRNPNLYSTRRLIQAARIRGHHVFVVDTMSVAVEVGINTPPEARIKIIKPNSGPRVQSRGVRLNSVSYVPRVEAIIPRIGASVTEYGLAVVRQFEAEGVLTTATSQAIAQSRDKLVSLQVMHQAGLPTPKTVVIARPQALYSAIHAVGGAPVIIKLLQGTQGRGVLLIPNLATAAAVFERLHGAKRHALVQEYVAESRGKDTRIIVIGDRCVAAMTRTAVTGEFRANLHLGGTAEPVSPSHSMKKLALEAVHALGLSVAGVDIIEADRGPLLLEVNSSPGLEGIETVTQINVAAEIIGFLERSMRKQKRRHSHNQKRRR
jgi:ribosomal protein S6--L-glutamate ligase